MKRPSAIMRSALRAAAGGTRLLRPESRLVVLLYHRVLAAPDPLNDDLPDAESFKAHVETVASMFDVMTFGEGVRRLRDGTLPARAACFTFDDGYADNHDVAMPVLREVGAPATFFVATSYLDGGRMWNDTVVEALRRAPRDFDLTDLGFGRHALVDVAARCRVADELLGKIKYLPPPERSRLADAFGARAGGAAPLDLMMTRRKVVGLAAAGMEVGGHTRSHPILTAIPDMVAAEEIAGCRADLETLLGHPVHSFAYPNGRPGTDYSATHCRQVEQAGFTAAASTAWGSADAGSDPFQMPRIAPWDRTVARFATRVVRSLWQNAPDDAGART